MMVYWPVLFKLAGDDELIYFASKQDCIDETRHMIISDDDFMVDCLGKSYIIKYTADGIQFVVRNEAYTADDVTQMIQAHEFNAAQVCIMKVYFPTVAEAVMAMA